MVKINTRHTLFKAHIKVSYNISDPKMKLLGWMHRKFRQNNSSETPKDHFSTGFTGQAYMDDLQCYNNSTINKQLPFSKSQRDHHHHHYRRNSFTSLESARDEQHNHELMEPSENSDLTELFHGFLAIGTLGCPTDINNNEYPQTPTFYMDDHLAAKQTHDQAITENELKLINDELEKVLIGEDNASSGRNSHVSSGARFSHCSSITLSGKPSSEEDQIADGVIVCPLQSYLLGSAVAAAAQPPPAAAVKKEQRTSLGELFQKTKQAEETNPGAKSEKDKSAVHVVKKMLKKRIVHAIDSETKLHKILQIFNRKVHPENYSSANCEGYCGNKGTKIVDHEMKNNDSVNFMGSIRRRSSAEDIIIYPDQYPVISKENTWSCKTHSHNWPQIMRSGGGGVAGNEFWVKTDSDYLVLEL